MQLLPPGFQKKPKWSEFRVQPPVCTGGDAAGESGNVLEEGGEENELKVSLELRETHPKTL